jgi:phage terminase small subunit
LRQRSDNSLNATQPARAAGFGKSSANVQGHRFRRKPHVATAIERSLADRIGVTRSRIIEEVSRLAFSSINDVLTIEDGKLVLKDHAALNRDSLSTVASVRESVNEKGHRSIEVRQHDRLAALTLCAHYGMLINKTELSGPGGKPSRLTMWTSRRASGPGSTRLRRGCRASSRSLTSRRPGEPRRLRFWRPASKWEA